MARTVKALIKDYRDTNEMMTLDDFKFCIKEANYHLAMVKQCDFRNPAFKTHLNIAAEIILEVATCFNDKENLINWIKGKPCFYYHPITHRKVEIKVRDDFEAIYVFLKYCMKIKQHETIDEDFFNYLSYILCEPADI